MLTKVEAFVAKYPKFSSFVSGGLGATVLMGALHFGLIKVL
jgi:hypothetical protein